MCAEIVVTVILNHVTITSHIISGRVNSFVFFTKELPKTAPNSFTFKCMLFPEDWCVT